MRKFRGNTKFWEHGFRSTYYECISDWENGKLYFLISCFAVYSDFALFMTIGLGIDERIIAIAQQYSET